MCEPPGATGARTGCRGPRYRLYKVISRCPSRFSHQKPTCTDLSPKPTLQYYNGVPCSAPVPPSAPQPTVDVPKNLLRSRSYFTYSIDRPSRTQPSTPISPTPSPSPDLTLRTTVITIRIALSQALPNAPRPARSHRIYAPSEPGAGRFRSELGPPAHFRQVILISPRHQIARPGSRPGHYRRILMPYTNVPSRPDFLITDRLRAHGCQPLSHNQTPYKRGISRTSHRLDLGTSRKSTRPPSCDGGTGSCADSELTDLRPSFYRLACPPSGDGGWTYVLVLRPRLDPDPDLRAHRLVTGAGLMYLCYAPGSIPTRSRHRLAFPPTSRPGATGYYKPNPNAPYKRPASSGSNSRPLTPVTGARSPAL